jgi:A/G-specific adenine glycosylase
VLADCIAFPLTKLKSLDSKKIRASLARWYRRSARDLPWRRTRDPYAIWVSEIMLQQTRVAAAIPYYERFLERFPDAAALARAGETEVLALWSGLGYYSRARNLQKAAHIVAARGAFPVAHAEIRELPGIGDYTAAAVASIAFGLPHAVVDGNVRRVVARLTNNAEPDAQTIAQALLDRRNPGRSNQALMELGALVCLPRNPSCELCPVAGHCEARRAGSQQKIPPPRVRPGIERLQRTLWIVRRSEKVLLVPSTRVRGFWDLPEPFEGGQPGRKIGMFRHTILNRQYTFEVREGHARRFPRGSCWFGGEPDKIALSTIAKKALQCLGD